MMSEYKIEELTYEQAVSELEKIVSKLETGDVTLDESMELFQNGMMLSKYCSDKLQQMEEKITALITMPDQSIAEQPFGDLKETENE
jgi:exodeoxyribonuclease VII small subunit